MGQARVARDVGHAHARHAVLPVQARGGIQDAPAVLCGLRLRDFHGGNLFLMMVVRKIRQRTYDDARNHKCAACAAH